MQMEGAERRDGTYTPADRIIMQIAIERPEVNVRFQGDLAVQQHLRLSYGLWLFRT